MGPYPAGMGVLCPHVMSTLLPSLLCVQPGPPKARHAPSCPGAATCRTLLGYLTLLILPHRGRAQRSSVSVGRPSDCLLRCRVGPHRPTHQGTRVYIRRVGGSQPGPKGARCPASCLRGPGGSLASVPRFPHLYMRSVSISPCGEGQRGPQHSDGQEVSGHSTYGKAFALKGVFTPVVSHPCCIMALGLPCLALPPRAAHL